MEKGANPIQAAAEALKSGADIEQAVYGTPGNSASELGNNSPEPSFKPEIEVKDGSEPAIAEPADDKEDSTPSMDSTIKVNADESKATQKSKSTTPDKVKQYEQGMRKFQAERDALKKEKEALAKEHSELKAHWDSLEAAYAKEGLAGVLNAVAGDPNAYNTHLQREFERRAERERATPSQREKMDLEDRLAKLEKDLNLERKAKTEFEQKISGQRAEAEQKELQSVVNPLFDKYRFTGKLGDEEAEYYYDKALWKETMDNLDGIPEESISREVIENEFKKVAGAFRKVINRQVESKTKTVIATKKKDASEAAAAKATSGMTSSAATDEFRSNMRSGNIQDAFRQLISGKIRLS